MATTEATAAYHKPLVSKYIRYVYPDFSSEQYQAIETLAEAGAVELSALHELAIAKFLHLRRESVEGYDLCCDDSGLKYEAKYKRLVDNHSPNGDYYMVKLGSRELRSKTADYLWVTVYNQFLDNEDHFLIPLSEITGKSFSFSYNREADNYNQGDRFHVRRNFFSCDGQGVR